MRIHFSKMLRAKQQNKMMPLNKLLDEIELSNKKDSWDYTGGHLNHNHLFKPQVLEAKTFWRSGQNQQKFQHDKPIYDIASSKSDEKGKKMKDSFTHFTVKTSVVPSLNTKSASTSSPVIKHFGTATPINTPFASSLLGTQSYGTCMDNLEYDKESLQGEELEIPDFKVLTFDYELYKTKKDYKDKYKFIPTFFSGLTKSDQFKMFLQFDEEVIQRQHLTNNFFNSSSVEYCKKKLTKNAYELYVNYLLDSQSPLQHEVILSKIAGMKKRAVRTEDVHKAEVKVKELEQKTLCALQHNDQLRNNFKDMNLIISDTDAAEADSSLDSQEEKSEKQFYLPNEEETFVSKRSRILKTYHEVKALEDEIRKNMTHMVNSEALEQYIKDVQIETVKLQSSNFFLQRTNKDLDSEIKRLLMKQKLNLEKQEEMKRLVEPFLKFGEM
ncbi:uncharacterized protein C6orf118 homolog isoform X5 [Aquarana catesbeiana]|uniref:uncharacterized protein C6orf118 homolog isoform X5 n=1 Tax=Aquarana catesbeiana TaxID=8400 RepID=UPI003CCA45C8